MGAESNLIVEQIRRITSERSVIPVIFNSGEQDHEPVPLMVQQFAREFIESQILLHENDRHPYSWGEIVQIVDAFTAYEFLDPEIRNHFGNHGNWQIRAAAAPNIQDPNLLDRIVNDHVQVRFGLGRNKFLLPRHTGELVHDGVQKVRSNMASSTVLTDEDILDLSIDTDWVVRRTFAQQATRLTDPAIENILNDPFWPVPCALLENSKGSLTIPQTRYAYARSLARVNPHEEDYVVALVTTFHIPMRDRVNLAAQSHSDLVRRRFFRSLQPDQVQDLANHPNPKIRALVSKQLVEVALV